MINILIIGLIQCVIFLALNLQKSNKNRADHVLLLWLTVFTAHLLMLLMEVVDLAPPPLQVFSKAIVLLHGPILFIYATTIFKNENRRYLSLHLVPFMLFSLFGLVMFPSHYRLWQDALLVGKVSSILAYPLLTIHWLNKRSRVLRNENSNNIVLEINWIKALALLLFSSYLISLIFVLFNEMLGWELDNNLDLIVYVIMITVMGYYGLKLGVVFTPDSTGDKLQEQIKKSYQHSPLRDDQMQQIETQITTHFSTHASHLNPNFSIQLLSDSLQIPKHHLSQVINRKMNTSFYELVNSNRVQYAKEKLLSAPASNHTLESIGYSAGFNTKAAFFSHFKKMTGKTPGQFRKEMGID